MHKKWLKMLGAPTTTSNEHIEQPQSRGVKSASSCLSDSNGGCYVPDVGLPLNSTTPSSI